MTTPADADIASLFAPAESPEPFRQGVVLTFNPATGANTVQVGNAVLTNLPILVSGDTVNYVPGDVVILLKYRSSWALFGRIVVPGATELTAAAVSFATLSAYASNFQVNTTYIARATGTVTVPSWANQASFVIVGLLGAINSTGATGIIQAYVDVDGNAGNVPYMEAPATNAVSVTPAFAKTISVTGGATITARLMAATSVGTWAASASARAGLEGTFIFRKA